MNRLLLAGALGVLLTLTACAQEVARDPTPTPTALLPPIGLVPPKKRHQS